MSIVYDDSYSSGYEEKNAFYGHLSSIIVMMVAGYEERKVHFMSLEYNAVFLILIEWLVVKFWNIFHMLQLEQTKNTRLRLSVIYECAISDDNDLLFEQNSF